MSLTWGRGTEMHAHKQFILATDIQVYFCDPQSPWQRGSNENTNGLLRQYMPKGVDLSTFSQLQLNAIARQLNERPRKTLGFTRPLRCSANVLHRLVESASGCSPPAWLQQCPLWRPQGMVRHGLMRGADVGCQTAPIVRDALPEIGLRGFGSGCLNAAPPGAPPSNDSSGVARPAPSDPKRKKANRDLEPQSGRSLLERLAFR